MKVHTLRVLLAAVLALMAALVIIYAMLSLRAYFGHGSGKESAAPLTDQQKLDILTSLKASSTPSTSDQRKTLKSLSAHASTSVSDQQKLDILKSLQGK